MNKKINSISVIIIIVLLSMIVKPVHKVFSVFSDVSKELSIDFNENQEHEEDSKEDDSKEDKDKDDCKMLSSIEGYSFSFEKNSITSRFTSFLNVAQETFLPPPDSV